MEDKDYVSLEVAKLLKEKGIEIPSIYFYSKPFSSDGKETEYILDCECYDESPIPLSDVEEGDYLAPTLYEVQKELREKGYAVNPYLRIEGWLWSISRCDEKFRGIFIEESIRYSITDGVFSTYEEALNDGIKQALKYI